LLLPSSCCGNGQNHNNKCDGACCCCWNNAAHRLRHRPIPHTLRGVERLQPIIWKLNTRRHYHNLPQVPCHDTLSWHEKRNQGVFRGKLTGGGGVPKSIANANDNNAALLSNEAKCRQMPRCSMVLRHLNSSWVDARLTSTSGKVPDVIVPERIIDGQLQQQQQHPGWNLTAPKPLSLQEMLSYKAIIILEGNDVSSGLKWALLSNSVVIMPPPTMTSWLMEELLEPWVHYVPLQPHDGNDFSDVEAQVQWVVQHAAEAQRIAHRATLWIKDLVFHADAAKDDEYIYREMLRRYQQHFAPRAAS
jgi:Glycosyl transferase family 90